MSRATKTAPLPPPPRTIRLVSDVPDFRSIYCDSSLSPRMAARLWAVAEILYDDFHLGLADDIVSQLPPIARLHADERFVTAFASRFAVIAKRLAEGLDCLEWIATCTADEMAVHLILAHAEDLSITSEPAWIETLPGRDPDEDEDEDDFDLLVDLLFQDTDVLMLYNPALDGIEDPDSPIGQQLGIANLHPNDWFKQFDDVA
jgi:hypothetical protein